MRLFVGVPLPQHFFSPIQKLQKALSFSGVKLIPPRNLHFTLKFLGEVKSAKGIIDTLNEIEYQKITVELSGTGVFPHENFVSVVWVGMKENPSFVSLMKQVDQKLGHIHEHDHNELVPHLTIARVKSQRHRKEIVEVLKKYKDKMFGSFVVDHFTLFESVFIKNRTRFKSLKSFMATNL